MNTKSNKKKQTLKTHFEEENSIVVHKKNSHSFSQYNFALHKKKNVEAEERETNKEKGSVERER